MNQNFVTGFVKKAQEYGFSEDEAVLMLKNADVGTWLGQRWDDVADTGKLMFNKAMNNPLVHGLTAVNPLVGEARGIGPKGFGDYFTGIGDRYRQSQDVANQNIAGSYNDIFQHSLQQEDMGTANDYMAKAQERIGWVQGPEQKMNLAQTFADSRENYNTGAANKWQADQLALQQKDEMRNKAQGLLGGGLFNPTNPSANIGTAKPDPMLKTTPNLSGAQPLAPVKPAVPATPSPSVKVNPPPTPAPARMPY
jgi:hypothetical protein